MPFKDRILSYGSWSTWQQLLPGQPDNYLPVNRLRVKLSNVFEKHETGALITMILMIIGSAFRIWLVVKKKEETQLKWIAFGFYLLGFCCCTFTGFMGGTMVYNFMMALLIDNDI